MKIQDLNPRRFLEFETRVKPNDLGLPEYDHNDVPIHDKRVYESDRGHVMINIREAKIMNDQSVRTGKIYILDEDNPFNIDVNDIEASRNGMTVKGKADEAYKKAVEAAIVLKEKEAHKKKVEKVKKEKPIEPEAPVSIKTK